MNGKLKELRSSPHLSNSQLNCFLGCGLQFYFKYQLGLPERFRSSALVLGSATHRVLEDYYSALVGGEVLSSDDLQELFELRFQWICASGEDVRYKKGEDYQCLVEKGKSLIKCFSENLPEEDARVLFVEEAFSIDLPGVELPVVGAMDLVLETDDSLIVVDHKTAARAYSNVDIDLMEQLTLYKMAIAELYPNDKEVLLRLDVLVKTKEPRLEQYWTSRDWLDQQRLIKKYQVLESSIKAGNFIPVDGGFRCGGCSYTEECKQWGSAEAA